MSIEIGGVECFLHTEVGDWLHQLLLQLLLGR